MKYYLLFLLLLPFSSAWAATTYACPDYRSYSFGTLSAEEQLHLELINRARAKPKTEARRYGITVMEGIKSSDVISTRPVAPLVANRLLNNAASKHAEDMADRDYFSHYSKDGRSPADRVEAEKYDYTTISENLGYDSSTGKLEKAISSVKIHEGLFVDAEEEGRGHRINILNPNFKEVGLGMAFGIRKSKGKEYNTYYLAADFASSADSQCHFITGVVFEDKDKDKFYTVGEGIGSVKVVIEDSRSSTRTASAGGYAIPVENGTYTVTFSHSKLGSYTTEISVKGKNVKLDVLANQFSESSTTPEPSEPAPDSQYPASTYEASNGLLKIKAMAAEGFTEKFDVVAKFEPSLPASTKRILQGQFTAMTEEQRDESQWAAFSLQSTKPTTTAQKGATYYLPRPLLEIHNLQVKLNNELQATYQAVFIYIEAQGKGYLVLYATKSI